MRRTRTTRTTAVVGVALAAFVCAAPAADAATTRTVTMNGFTLAYSPQTVRVPRGSSVVWKNLSSLTHTTTSNTGLWNRTLTPHTGTYKRTFLTPGTYRYHCNIHAGMTGKVVVS